MLSAVVVWLLDFHAIIRLAILRAGLSKIQRSGFRALAPALRTLRARLVSRTI